MSRVGTRSAEVRGKQAMDDEKQLKKQKTGGGGDAKSREQDVKNFHEFVEKLKSNVSEEEARAILSENAQEMDSSISVYEHCADQMMYGPLEPCPSCGGALKFAVHEYTCTGYISEWSKCGFSTKNVPRKKEPLKIPKQLKNDYITKWEQEHDTEKRPVRHTEDSAKPAPGKPFSGMHILLAGRTKRPQYKLRGDFEKHGGKVAHALKEGITCLVVAESDLSSGVYAKIGDARSKNIPVVKESWLQDCLSKNEVLDFAPYLFGAQAEGDKRAAKKQQVDQGVAADQNVDSSTYLTDEIKLAGKKYVHKDSELDKEGGRVFEHEGIVYNCAFSICDQTSGLNHCAAQQLVQVPDGTLYFYHKRGRLATGVPVNERMDEQTDVNKAIHNFAALFKEITGNEFEAWEREKKFTKKRSKFYPVDMDDVCDARAGGLQDQQLGVVAVHCKLDPKVARFCKCLFSQAVYRHAMFEMGINSPELPLGSLSEFHFKRCEECLLEFADFLRKESDSKKHEQMCLDFSNKWFSLVPSTHPTVISDIAHLTELGASVLESLKAISVASHIIGDMTGDTLDDPLSDRYAKLNSTMTCVDKESDDYKMVQKYLEKTYEPVKYDDVSVSIVMEELFMVESSAGPSFEEVDKLKNKVLLWCGTRTCNLISTLAQGMQPAIYNAPVPGYMFGKGLYCTDASCKAASYAFTGVDRPEGFLMLAVVGLGDNVLELPKPEEDVAKYEREKVAIKALGKKLPDSSEYFKWKNNITVPCGALKSSGRDDCTLDYNEYVVYDPKQVKLQYIVQVRYEEK
ncbi:hypothetical protein SELMODRAFT_422701 [Selaginella moellendorffii]|uniref:Poly [ADP-ribose] polymerase n=1 Tax=Selaginella moellendorffii TaxID=88036 RepID=D8SJ96_SELML|nr:poly [ADP-ribose] polymerase 3 isoform X1 [Selaginella moellendorffii]EFJ15760.1 hypothetical protein SELMODRAFT_422701 [Selaginella moellendorffii]|eukprot:XP_002983418.1 poly [ADP-ribose] polymerase 3 isoform X1 [Selaginella moellendorffii]